MGVNYNQGNLDTMSGEFNAKLANCASSINRAQADLITQFSENWISQSAQELANEIAEAACALSRQIEACVNNINQKMIAFCGNTQGVETSPVTWESVSYDNPQMKLDLPSTLPNGNVGVADNGDVTKINVPVQTMKQEIGTELNAMVFCVASIKPCDPETNASIEGAIKSVQNFLNSTLNDLEDSLRTRSSAERGTRDDLRKANTQIFGQN